MIAQFFPFSRRSLPGIPRDVAEPAVLDDRHRITHLALTRLGTEDVVRHASQRHSTVVRQVNRMEEHFLGAEPIVGRDGASVPLRRAVTNVARVLVFGKPGAVAEQTAKLAIFVGSTELMAGVPPLIPDQL